MGRTFSDGAEFGDTAKLAANNGWNPIHKTDPQAQVRSGDYAYSLIASGTTLGQRNFAVVQVAKDEYFIRWAEYFENFDFVDEYGNAAEYGSFFAAQNGTQMLAFLAVDRSTHHVALRLADTRGADGMGGWGDAARMVQGWVAASSSQSIQAQRHLLFQLHYKVGTENGVIELKVDGKTVLTYTGDTQPGAFATIDTFVWCAGSAIKNNKLFVDDIAINDTTGLWHNSWPGPGRFILIKPTGSTTSQWDGSDGNQTENHLLVGDVPSDGDETYLEALDTGLEQFFTKDALAVPGAILGMWIEGRAKDTSASGAEITLVIKNPTGETKETTVQLAGEYGAVVSDYTSTAPDGENLAPWTFDALEFGVRS